MLNKSNGITLIALVMTIVIMLILTTVTIGSINGGLFNYTNKSVSITELASIIEELTSLGLLDGRNNLNGTLSQVLGGDYSKYDSTFKVVNGELIYMGEDPKIIECLLELGQKEETIEIASAICATKGHNFIPANYLNPKTCTRCGYTEGEKLVATAPHPDQSTDNTDIGIGTDGQLVNLDNWSYKYEQWAYKLTGYKGTYTADGRLAEGVTVPQTIKNINVTYMDGVFQNATSLKIAPVIPPTIVSLKQTFKGCTALTEAPMIPNGVKEVSYMFQNCTSLETLPEGFNLPNSVTGRIIGLFSGCTSLKELPSNFRVPSAVTSMFSWFNGCTNLEKLPDGFTVGENVSELLRTFQDCTKLTKLPDSFRLTIKARELGYMFSGSGITGLPDGFTITEGCTSMGNMFNACTALVSLPDSFTIPSTMKSIDQAFQGCTNLTALPDGFILPEGLTTTYTAFYHCKNLQRIPDNFVIPESTTEFGRTFWDCPKLEGTILIKGNPSGYGYCLSSAALSGDGLTVQYTDKCTNISGIMATVSSGANITFEEITLK